jgi:vancomycin resistance protein YoaR
MELHVVIKSRKTPLIFLLIMIQSTLAITAGVVVLFSASIKDVPPKVFVGGLDISGMPYSDATGIIESDYSEKFQSNVLKLNAENGKSYEVPFSQIEAALDGNATIASVKTIKGIRDIPKLLQIYFSNSGTELSPVIKFNESKLRMALVEISDDIRVEPIEAHIYYSAGTVQKIPDTAGVSLNVTNAVEIIKQKLSEDPFAAITLDSANGYVLQPENAAVTMRDYDDIQQVLAECTTTVIDEELLEDVRFAAEAINGVILPASVEGGIPPEFSFVECLEKANADFENERDGYNQVASTLYKALLSAGIPKDSIIRIPHEFAADYIDPGLDAWISGDAGDLKFTSHFSHKTAIFTEFKDGRITVAVAGSMKDKKEDYKITTEVVQRFKPSVVYVENSSLEPGERIILNPGKEGVMVNVFRNDELISTDEYKAEKSIVQIAPNTDWDQESK